MNTALAAISHAEREAKDARRRSATVIWSGRLAVAVTVAVGWELAAGRLISVDTVSRPSDIFAAWTDLLRLGLLQEDLIVTLQEFVVGFAFGIAAGIAAGIVLTLRELGYRLIEPYILAIYGIPKVALAPLFILWFGIGILPKEVLVGVLTFFLVFVNTVAGVRSVRPETIQVMRVLGARSLAMYRLVIIPHSVPIVLTAIRASIPSGMLGAVLGEMLGGGRGLGYLLLQATNYFNIAQTFAILAVLAAMVLAFRTILLPVEAWVSRHETA